MASRIGAAAVALGVAAVGATSASAQGVIMERNISLDAARVIAETAIAACRADGNRITVTVVDRSGRIKAQLSDDGTSLHTTENSFRKAYTARTTRAPSQQLADRAKKEPVSQLALANFVAGGGGLPIKVGDETIGGVGVSGSPSGKGLEGGQRDAACAQAGIDKAAATLK